MPRLPALLLLMLALPGCASPGSDAPGSARALLMAAAGTYDNSKDALAKVDNLRRKVTWRERPPVDAREVHVIFDEEQRPTSWRVELQDTPLTLQDLTEANSVTPLGTSNGADVFRVEGGPVSGTLALVRGRDMTLISQPYLINWERNLLRFAPK